MLEEDAGCRGEQQKQAKEDLSGLRRQGLLPSSRRDPRGEEAFARRPEHRVGRGIPACNLELAWG